MDNKQPYLSIVIYSRNDNYEGNAFDRLQLTVDNLILQAKQYQLNAELIIVDWNPPEDKPLLQDALFFPSDLGPLSIRFIVVPPRIHRSYKCSPKINIIPVAALNVGIRRAKGKFIWPTNADLLFSNELVEFLSKEKLEKEYFYRVFRYSVDENVLKYNSLGERMSFCHGNIVQVYQKNTVSIHGLPEHPILQTSCGGDFIVFSKEFWEKIKGYPELNNLGAFTDWLLCYVLYLAGLKEKILLDAMKVYHIDHKKHKKQRQEFSQSLSNFVRYNVYHKLSDKSRIKMTMKIVNTFKNNISTILTDIFYSFIVPIIKKVSGNGDWDLNTAYSYWGFHKTLISMLKHERSYIYNDDNWGLPRENFAEHEK